MTTLYYTGYDGIQYSFEKENPRTMPHIIEPKINNYEEYLALVDAMGGTLNAIVYIYHLGYRLPNGNAIEAGFFMNASSQGFRVLMQRDPNSPSFWCPWGTVEKPLEYVFYVIVKGENE